MPKDEDEVIGGELLEEKVPSSTLSSPTPRSVSRLGDSTSPSVVEAEGRADLQPEKEKDGIEKVGSLDETPERKEEARPEVGEAGPDAWAPPIPDTFLHLPNHRTSFNPKTIKTHKTVR